VPNSGCQIEENPVKLTPPMGLDSPRRTQQLGGSGLGSLDCSRDPAGAVSGLVANLEETFLHHYFIDFTFLIVLASLAHRKYGTASKCQNVLGVVAKWPTCVSFLFFKKNRALYSITMIFFF
jgi:hypothetical protein